MSKKSTKRALASAAALCLVLSSTPVMAAENTTAPERLYGQGRVQTAIKVAEQSWNNAWKDSKTAVLAPSADKNLVDALAVSPLAYKLNAPILLNDAKDSINADTLKALKDQGVKKVYVATGEGVISNEAVKELKDANMEVVRLGGASRYATAKKIYDEFKANGGNAENVALVSGTGLADALSVSSIASKEGMPILLTNGTDTVAADLKEVAEAAKKVYAVGGTGVISDALVSELKATRLGGDSRFETNAEVIKAFAKDGKVKFNKVYLANGMNNHLVDALTGSVLAAQTESPVVLASDNLDASVKEALKGKVTDKTNVVAFGGEAVVSGDVIEATKNVNKEDSTAAELKVESVVASNLKEVEVKFNQKVEKDSAEEVENYTIADHDIDTAEVLEDGCTVRLTFKDGKELSNQKEYKVSVKGVKAGDKKIDVKDIKFTPVDVTLPTVEKVESLGTKAIKVTFSEPIKEVPTDAVKLDGKAFYGSRNHDGRELVLRTYSSSSLSVGDHKLTVDGVKDYQGLKSLSKECTFTVVEDKVAPTVTNAEATLEKLTLTFSEDVDSDTVKASNVYYKNGDDKVKANSLKKLAGNKYSFDFKDKELPSYETTVYVEKVEDYSSNVIKDTEVKVKAKVDETRPEVKDVKVNDDNNEITVKFSKELNSDSVKIGCFVITNEDGDKVPVKNVTLDKDTVKVATYKALEGGTYKLKVTALKDNTKLKNMMLDYTTELNVKDGEEPTVTISTNGATRTIVLTFSEEMDTESIADKSNYLIMVDGHYRTLPDDTDVTVLQDSKAVMFVLPEKIGDIVVKDEFGHKINNLQVMAVKDKAENVIKDFPKELKIGETNKTNIKIKDNEKQVKLTDKNTIELKFDQSIQEVKNDAVTIKDDDNTYKVESVKVDGSSKVIVKTEKDMPCDADALKISIVGSKVKTAAGSGAEDINELDVIDKVKPEVVKDGIDNKNNNEIRLTFNEALEADPVAVAMFARDLEVTRTIDEEKLVADKDYSTSVDGKDLVIKLEGDADASRYTVKVKKDAEYIKDTHGNEAVESSLLESELVTADHSVSAPTITVKDTDNSGALNAGDVITLKFDEKVKLADEAISGDKATDDTFVNLTNATAVSADDKEFSDTWTITLEAGDLANVSLNAAGESKVQIKIDKSKVEDTVSNNAKEDLTVSMPTEFTK
ncbi:cell wall-binding repeat-containing protein [Haloimpatiens sp. FM7330]|uniref:cell wall-binding repeat-containing protein n=1 Tax=Haloimpatiens sp. FM7330 TaxID=3298610 RepID=UPI0036339F67